MRTTSGADAFYANDRPPDDATFVEAAARRRRDHPRQGQHGRVRAAATRSSFGGTMCNPYDTERDPGRSSGGSGSSVAANLVTCAIGEETGPSVREPAKNNNAVGARADAGAGQPRRHDPAPVMNDARRPDLPHRRGRRAHPRRHRRLRPEGRADGVQRRAACRRSPTRLRAGARASTACASASCASTWTRSCSRPPTTRASSSSTGRVDDLRRLGATIVDPGAGGALFQSCVDKYAPSAANGFFIRQFPELFPVDAAGKPAADHMPLLVDMFFDPALFPDGTDDSRPWTRRNGRASASTR